jgi:peroxiredoxin (alkyl hydroperoxide reductase subunit C)
MSLVRKKAPAFVAPAVVNGTEIVEDFSLEQYLGKKYVVFFFYPLDFTFVCPTELLAFQELLPEFEKRGCAVVGCSVDSKYSHFAWLTTPKKKGGIEGVKYPVVADLSKSISSNYGVLAGDFGYTEDGLMDFQGDAQAFRGTFLIDKEGIVRHSVINDMPLGRNIHETLRMVDALIHHETYGEVCPANWSEGQEAMKETAEGVASYLSAH